MRSIFILLILCLYLMQGTVSGGAKTTGVKNAGKVAKNADKSGAKKVAQKAIKKVTKVAKKASDKVSKTI